jgi:hypothetical protein
MRVNYIAGSELSGMDSHLYEVSTPHTGGSVSVAGIRLWRRTTPLESSRGWPFLVFPEPMVEPRT